jgi:hypothetical protein
MPFRARPAGVSPFTKPASTFLKLRSPKSKPLFHAVDGRPRVRRGKRHSTVARDSTVRYQRSLSCGEYSTAIVSRAWTVRRQCGPKRIRKFYADGRKMSGSSELGLGLTDIVINERSYPLLAAMYEIKGSGEGSKTTRKVLGGADLVRSSAGPQEEEGVLDWRARRRRRWNGCSCRQEGAADLNSQ